MKWLRFPRTLGILVCVYLIGMSVLFGVLWSRGHHFLRNADQVTGTVTALVPRAPVGSTREPRSNARMRSLAPTVKYEVNGKTYEYTAAHGRYQPRHAVGDRVTVLYQRENPAVARIQGEGRVLVPMITIGFVLSALLVALLLVRTRHLGSSATPAAPGTPTTPGTPARTIAPADRDASGPDPRLARNR